MITLVMIVRDEEKTIADTLRSVLPAVDRVCIVDTGSKDGTVREMRETLIAWGGLPKEKPVWGYAVHPWVDYSTNRNQALDLAEREFGPDQWLLMLDADTRVEGVQALRRYLVNESEQNPPDDSFQLMAQYKGGGLRWPMHRIFRAGSGWRYQGVVHEVPAHTNRGIVAPGPIIPGVTVVYQGTDAGKKEATWREHVRLLRAAIDRRRDGYREAPREAFYLAQTYACLGQLTDARGWYIRRHQTHVGYAPERWYAGLQYIWLSQTMGADIDPGMILMIACERPWRAEGWYRLALEYGDLGEWDRCYAYACIASSLPIPRPELDAYMIQTDVYNWEANVLRAVAACEIDARVWGMSEICRARGESTGLPEGEKLRLDQLEERAR